MDFTRNNLDLATSPYLLQHRENPVWWQEWSEEALEYARRERRIVLVSVGYSTCHWCHVMAADAFSDAECASILNRHFLPIKVDREERPDIDHYLMSYLVATTGSGGWPLNAFLTPDGDPFFAMTYASTEPRFSMPGFADILGRIREFYDEHRGEIRPFELNAEHSRVNEVTAAALDRATSTGSAQATDETPVAMISDEDERETNARIQALERAFDTVHAGFGTSQKFPPHSALLFLQYAAAAGFEQARPMVRDTLNEMMTRGLHDHLQGGFFRYTVDREWTIPHFEKMLYDQAMLLWNYALASRLFNRAGYRETAAGIVRALEETFRVGAGYASGHDADTNHREGATYVWKLEEIRELLDPDELDAFLRSFAASEAGNFERRNHLVRILPPGVHADEPKAAKRAPAPEMIERAKEKLLAARRERDQPPRDDKVILSWNALAGCGLLAAHRYAEIPGARDRAVDLAAYLVETFVGDEGVGHVALGGRVQRR
ncbi:MAG: thioredoxin domain-containing protein, partial [Spirochaetota bacterium]